MNDPELDRTIERMVVRLEADEKVALTLVLNELGWHRKDKTDRLDLINVWIANPIIPHDDGNQEISVMVSEFSQLRLYIHFLATEKEMRGNVPF